MDHWKLQNILIPLGVLEEAVGFVYYNVGFALTGKRYTELNSPPEMVVLFQVAWQQKYSSIALEHVLAVLPNYGPEVRMLSTTVSLFVVGLVVEPAVKLHEVALSEVEIEVVDARCCYATIRQSIEIFEVLDEDGVGRASPDLTPVVHDDDVSTLFQDHIDILLLEVRVLVP